MHIYIYRYIYTYILRLRPFRRPLIKEKQHVAGCWMLPWIETTLRYF